MQSLLLSSIEDANERSSNTYTNPLQEVFGLTQIDQELAQSKPTTINLQIMLLSIAQDMKKSYPITQEKISP